MKWDELRKGEFQLNNKTTAVDREKAGMTNVSEYKIGHTIYTVKTVYNPAFQESLSDILKRLIVRESEKLPGQTGQEPEKQVV